jgi:hypothetical protein
VLSPRQLATNENMLAWPERFPAARVREFEYELGQYAFAGQYQQSPTPRKGGILKREYWQPCVVPRTGAKKGQWPDFNFVIVSVDSAFTEKEENDPTGCTTWGVWTDPTDGYPKVMLIMRGGSICRSTARSRSPRSATMLPNCNIRAKKRVASPLMRFRPWPLFLLEASSRQTSPRSRRGGVHGAVPVIDPDQHYTGGLGARRSSVSYVLPGGLTGPPVFATVTGNSR